MTDVTTLSDVELKALGYDTVQELERVQNNLNIIRTEMNRRAQEQAHESVNKLTATEKPEKKK